MFKERRKIGESKLGTTYITVHGFLESYKIGLTMVWNGIKIVLTGGGNIPRIKR